jgi:hypothetical protein
MFLAYSDWDTSDWDTSDWDTNDISELYVWSPEKNNIVQLTQLTDTTSEIGEMHWSPDGTRIAFSFRDRESHVNIPLLGIVYISGSEYRVSTFEVASSGFWWQDPVVLVVPGFYVTSNNIGADGIHWIDVTTGESIQHFLISESPGSYIIMPQSLNENELGFFGGDNRFYIYDLFTRVLEKQANFGDSLLISQWKAAPASFPGENACQP